MNRLRRWILGKLTIRRVRGHSKAVLGALAKGLKIRAWQEQKDKRYKGLDESGGY